MAGILSPVLGDGVQGTSPTRQTSGVEVAADLIGAFANSVGSSRGGNGPSFTEQQHQIEVANRQQLSKEYERANQLRTQGFSSEADKVIRHAHIEFTKITGKNPLDDAGKNMYRSSTGDTGDPEFAGMSEDERAIAQVKKSADYQMYYMAAPADMPEEDKVKFAIQETQQRALDNANVARTASQWKNGGQERALRTLQSTLGAATSIVGQNPSMLSLDMVQQSRAEFESFKVMYQPPQGLSADDRKDWGEALGRADNFFKYLESVHGTGDIESRNKLGAAYDFSAVADMILKTDSTVGGRLISSSIRKGEPLAIQNLITQNQGNARALEIFNETFKMPMPDVGGQITSDPAAVDKAYGDKIGSMASNEKRLAAIASSALNNKVDLSSEIKSNPEIRNDWLDSTLTAISAVSSLDSAGTMDWIQSSDYTQIFTNEFFSNLDSFSQVDPESAGFIRGRAAEALSKQAMVLSQHLGSMEASNGGIFIWDQTQGTFRLNPNPTAFFSNAVEGAGAVQRAVDTYYGGDINAMIADKGGKLLRDAAIPDMRVPNAVTGVMDYKFSPEKQRMANAGTVLSNYFRMPVAQNAPKYAQALKTNETMFSKLMGDALAPQDQETPGVFSQTTQNNQPNTFNVASKTAEIMDRHEGGGDYNTLFGHSQRANGAFAGVQPSNMTIAELLDFTKPSGAYGQWVKGKVGRVATPIGRFQFVGSTIREVAKDLGIDINNTVFDENTQNQFFNHYANKVLGDKQGASARAALRGAWEGFKNVPDVDLDVAINEIRNGGATFGPGMTYGGSPQGFAPLVSSGGLLPPQGSTSGETREEPVGPSSLFGGGSTSGGGASGTVTQEAPQGASTGTTEASRSSTAQQDAAIASESAEVLRNLGLAQDTPVFNSYKELREADRKGELKDGQIVVVNGQPVEV